NIIHAWPELKAYARESIDVARLKLLDALASYKGVSSGTIIVVFDAYRVAGRREEIMRKRR
ncbi:MAG TPA: NYN domain-containing protein, partial [Firmicutes bacterium]|nr:NYN domain-containing protein [Bacillota bacterium]